MKLIAEIVKPRPIFSDDKIFHVRLPIGRRRFGHEDIIVRHIGPRPWSEMFWIDEQGHVHEVFSA